MMPWMCSLALYPLCGIQITLQRYGIQFEKCIFGLFGRRQIKPSKHEKPHRPFGDI